jgi:hypothetical protein
MSKISFIRTLLIISIIFVAGIDASFYYLAETDAILADRKIEQIVRDGQAIKLKEILTKINVTNDSLSKTNSISFTDGTNTQNELRSIKMQAFKIKLFILRKYKALSVSEKIMIARINLSYTKTIELLASKIQKEVVQDNKISETKIV